MPNSIWNMLQAYLGGSERNTNMKTLMDGMWNESADLGDGFSVVKDYIGCFAIGGSFCEEYQPFAAEAAYYEWRYEELGEDFICIGVPTYENSDSYEAVVSSFGVIPKNSRHPEEAYRFLKMVADSEVDPWYDLSVNRERSEETIRRLSTETLALRGGYGVPPMSEETADYLRSLIDHIGGASLPNANQDGIVRSVFMSYDEGDIASIDEAVRVMEDSMRTWLAMMNYAESFERE